MRLTYEAEDLLKQRRWRSLTSVSGLINHTGSRTRSSRLFFDHPLLLCKDRDRGWLRHGVPGCPICILGECR